MKKEMVTETLHFFFKKINQIIQINTIYSYNFIYFPRLTMITAYLPYRLYVYYALPSHHI